MFSSGEREGAHCFPGTFMFSARELKDAGLPKSKRRIRHEAVIEYHSKLLEI